MVLTHSVDGPVHRMTTNRSRFKRGRQEPSGEPIFHLPVVHDDGHPVVNIPAILVRLLR